MNSTEIQRSANLINRIAVFFRGRLRQIREKQHRLLAAALERRQAEELDRIRRDLENN